MILFATYLGVQGLFNTDPPLDPGLTSLDLSHDLLDVLQLVAALPEHSWGTRRTTTSHTRTRNERTTWEWKWTLPEYSMTSSGVLPSTSLAMFSMSSRPHFSLALMNWLKSRLFQMVNPCSRGGGTKTSFFFFLNNGHIGMTSPCRHKSRKGTAV